MVTIESQPYISYKIRQNCTLCEPWVKELLGQGLISQKNYKVK
jgi:hypothetical protein